MVLWNNNNKDTVNLQIYKNIKNLEIDFNCIQMIKYDINVLSLIRNIYQSIIPNHLPH